MKTNQIWILVALFGIVALVVGCGGSGDQPELMPVEGLVTLDAKPLAGATVVFRPESGKASRGVTDAEGRYELIYLRDIKGAKLGKHTVTITTASEMSPQERLPERYNRKTELTAQVDAETGSVDFALKSD